MFWWLLCAGSVGAMLGFVFAAMLAAGMRADLEERLATLRDSYLRVMEQRDSLKYAFDTLCGCIKKLGTEDK